MATIAERRLAAILAADVVGYSRLVEADEARTLGDLKIIRQEPLEPLLTENRGRIVIARPVTLTGSSGFRFLSNRMTGSAFERGCAWQACPPDVVRDRWLLAVAWYSPNDCLGESGMERPRLPASSSHSGGQIAEE